MPLIAVPLTMVSTPGAGTFFGEQSSAMARIYKLHPPWATEKAAPPVCKCVTTAAVRVRAELCNSGGVSLKTTAKGKRVIHGELARMGHPCNLQAL